MTLSAEQEQELFELLGEIIDCLGCSLCSTHNIRLGNWVNPNRGFTEKAGL